MEEAPQSLIGREDELRAMVASIEADRATIVIGEAGIGKTSLVRAAATAARRRLHEGGGFATLDWMPYLALRRALGLGLSGDAASVAVQVERAIGPDLLFVDDLQWCDEETLAALELSIGRILVVVAIRAGDPGSDRAFELATRAGAVALRLAGISDAAAAQLVHRTRPLLSTAATATIVDLAGGNPLLLEELAVSGEASTVLERALTGRLDLLTTAARGVVELIAVAEGPLPRRAVSAGIAEAIDAGVVTERGDMVEIRHALVGAAIRDRLPAPAARRLHGRLASIVVEQVERARHLAAAGRRDEAAVMAIEGLATVADPRDRATLLVIAAESSPPEKAPAMRLEAARALDEVSEWAAVRRTLEPAADLGSQEELAERDALLAHAAYAGGDPSAGRRHLDDAAARAIDGQSNAAMRRAIETATFLVNVDGAIGPAIATLDAAAAEQLGASPAAREVEILRNSILLLATGTGDSEMAAASIDEAFEAGRYRTATDRARVMQYLLLMGATAASALQFLLAQRARFEAAGVGTVAMEFLADAVQAAVLAGRPWDAVALADELLELPAPVRARQSAEIFRGRALLHLGQFDLAADALTRVAAWASPDFFGRGEALAGQSELAFWSGRASTAAKLAEESLAFPGPIPNAHVPTRLVRAWARSELGLDPGPGIDGPMGLSLAGAPFEVAGLQAWRAGDVAGAAVAFTSAADRWAGFHEPRALLCRWAGAESRRRAGELEAAVEGLGSTLESATASGFEAVVTRVRRSLRLAGVRVSGAARTQVLAAGGLTARERELVGLVEQGLTNVEIARRLGLGRPTVARILASAMTKLGVGSRAQLAASVPP